MEDRTRPISVTLDRGDDHRQEEWCLTVVFHPDTRRIGDQYCAPASVRAISVGRHCPDFVRYGEAGESKTGPLADPRLSREAFELLADSDGVLLRRGRSRLRVDGQEVSRERRAPVAALRAGLVLLVADCIVLFLSRRRAIDAALLRVSPLPGMTGISAAMRAVFRDVRRALESDADVLLLGATGTGKEMVARAVHSASRRAGGPWVAVNMGALTPELAAAALFGARRGAYTGADTHRRGYFQEAAGGTLFLDEIGDSPPEVQAQLLRAIQERELQVVGGGIERADLRILAASERSLSGPDSDFRQALRYRLGAHEISLPELGARQEDIGLLAGQLLDQFAGESAASWRESLVDEQFLARWARCFEHCLLRPWPGNVRELHHFLHRVVVALDPGDPASAELASAMSAPAMSVSEDATAPPEGVREAGVERQPLSALSDDEFQTRWCDSGFEVARLARTLGVSRQAVYRRLRKLEHYRPVSDIPLAELLKVMQESRGDLDASASSLSVSPRALRQRLRASGLIPGSQSPRS